MPVESQLKREFANFKRNVVIPEQLEAQITASFDHHYKIRKEQSPRRRMRGTARIAVVLCGLMLFGGVVYGAEKLWSITYGSTGIEVHVNQDYIEPAAFGKQTRQVIEDIQTQLAVNESAILYVAEPGGSHSLRMVNRPQLFSDIESWKKVIEPITGKLAVPGNLPEGYHFASAQSDSQVGITDSSWVKKYTNVLTKRLKTGEHYAWIKSFNIPNQRTGTVSPELVYEGPKVEGGSISVTYSPLGPQAHLSSDVGADTTVEELKVGAVDALYVVSQQSYDVSTTGYYAYIRWIVVRKDNDRNIMHQVSTDSPDVSKEMLLKVAEGLR